MSKIIKTKMPRIDHVEEKKYTNHKQKSVLPKW